MSTELAIDKGADGKPRAYKGRAFHMRTKAGDSVVIIAADAQAIERTLLEFGVHVHVNWDQCPQVRLSKDHAARPAPIPRAGARIDDPKEQA